MAANEEVHDLSDAEWEDVLEETAVLYLRLSEQADKRLCEAHRRDFDYTQSGVVGERLAAKLTQA